MKSYKLKEFLQLARLESQERERKSFVSELVNYRVINQTREGVYYGQDENDILAYTLENLIAHIFNPNNKVKLQWFESELQTRKTKTLNSIY